MLQVNSDLTYSVSLKEKKKTQPNRPQIIFTFFPWQVLSSLPSVASAASLTSVEDAASSSSPSSAAAAHDASAAAAGAAAGGAAGADAAGGAAAAAAHEAKRRAKPASLGITPVHQVGFCINSNGGVGWVGGGLCIRQLCPLDFLLRQPDGTFGHFFFSLRT